MVRVYRSTDVGARVLNGQPGSLINVLDVLVDGQGGQPGAGWTKPYSGTNKAVYKPQGANGYYRFDDSAARGGSYTGQGASIIAYETMTDVDTGIDRFPLVTDTQRYVFKSQTQDATARKWIAIADEFGFYLYIEGAPTTQVSFRYLTYFGRYNPHNQSDVWPYGFHSGIYEYLAWSTFSETTVNNTAHCLARSFNGLTKSIKAGNLLAPLFSASIVMRNPTDIMLSSTYGLSDSVDNNMVRCYLPGLYACRNTGTSINANVETGQLLDGPNGPGTLLTLCPASTANSSMRGLVAIDTVDWGR